MLNPTAVAALAALAAVGPVDIERMQDTGRTLRVVEELRARGEYGRAADELRGWTAHWQGSGPEVDAELRRMRALLRRMVELEELLQHAEQDRSAAAAYLRAVVDPAQPSFATIERARALAILARHDVRAATFLVEAFPARLDVVVESEPDARLSALDRIPFTAALVEMSDLAGLPIHPSRGDASLQVRMVVVENDRRHSLLAHTAMRSYAVHMVATLADPVGRVLLEASTTTSILGINPGFAARHGMERCARLLYEALIDEAAKRVDRRDLP